MLQRTDFLPLPLCEVSDKLVGLLLRFLPFMLPFFPKPELSTSPMLPWYPMLPLPLPPLLLFDVDAGVAAPSFPFMRPVVATGWGVAPNASVVQVPLDTNGDGRVDAHGTDTTGDGQVDTIVPICAPMERI